MPRKKAKKKQNIKKEMEKTNLVPEALAKEAPEREYINNDLNPDNPEDLEKLNEEARLIKEKFIEPERAKTAEKAMEEFTEIIESEEDLLREIPEDRMKVQLIWRDKLWKFKVKPIERGDNFGALNLDVDLLADIDVPTRKAMIDKGQGKRLTKHQEQLLTEFEADPNSKLSDSLLATAIEVLTSFVTPPDFKGDLERRKKYWTEAPFTFKLLIATEAFKLLGLDGESNFKLFQTSS